MIWLAAIAYPGWSFPGLLLGAAMVAFASFGLMVHKPDQDGPAAENVERSWNGEGGQRREAGFPLSRAIWLS